MASQQMIKVYTASCMHHGEMWRDLNGPPDWTNCEFVSRWLIHQFNETPEGPEFSQVFWQQDMDDIRQADVLLLYAVKEDNLRGALVEAGAALALGKVVILVGSNAAFGTWRFHPNVYLTSDLKKAARLIDVIFTETVVPCQ